MAQLPVVGEVARVEGGDVTLEEFIKLLQGFAGQNGIAELATAAVVARGVA